MNQEDQQQDQSYDFGGYDLQGYDVQAYEEQGFDAQAYQDDAQDTAGYYDEPLAEEPPMASAQARVPQAAPAYEDAAYDDEDDEDFPEPEEQPKKKGGNGRTVALAGIGALAVGGAVLVFNPLGLDLTPVTDMLPAEVTAMLPMGAPTEEAPAPDAPPADQAPPPAEDAEPPAPPDADSKEWQEPVAMKQDAQPEAATPQAAKPKPAAPAAKPKPPAPAAKAPAKPAAPAAKKPAPAKPAPVAKKPAPAKPKPAAVSGGMQASSVVRFERNSAWVAAAEMERLWAFSSKLKSGQGHITIEGIAGSEREASDLARRRAIRVAELLKNNNVGNQFKFTVKAITSPGDSPRVKVSYSQKL